MQPLEGFQNILVKIIWSTALVLPIGEEQLEMFMSERAGTRPGIRYRSLMVSETTDMALVFFNSRAMFSPKTAPRCKGNL